MTKNKFNANDTVTSLLVDTEKSKCWVSSIAGRYTYVFIPQVLTTLFINNRYLSLIFTNNVSFQQHLYQINRHNSPFCVYNKLLKPLYYILE